MTQSLAVCLSLLIASSGLAEPPILGPTSTVNDVLDALKTSGDNLKSLTANLKTDDFDSNLGSDKIRTGQFSVNTKPDGAKQLHLVYTARQFGNKKPVPERKEYLLDDGWVTVRDFVTSQEDRKQLAKPGQMVDVFQLDDGLIPMPIGQDPRKVLARFDVIIAPPDQDDPPGSTHIVLTPKAGSDYAQKYQKVDVWVDLKLKMPVRVMTTDAKGSMNTTYDLTDLKINQKVAKEEFQLPPLPPNWQTDEQPMKT
jgi:hypothetical protein